MKIIEGMEKKLYRRQKLDTGYVSNFGLRFFSALYLFTGSGFTMEGDL